MKSLNVITLIVVIVGAINWGLMGLFQVDLVAALLGGPQTALSRLIYILLGLSGIYQLIPLITALSSEVENPHDMASAGPSPEGAYGRYERDGKR